MANTFNPYPEIGSELTAGLTAIAGGTIASVDDLVNAIYNYVQPIYYPAGTGSVPKALEIEIKSVAYNVIDAYNNKALARGMNYTSAQMNLIKMMLGRTTTTTTPIKDLDHWFEDIESNITNAGLNLEMQTPLLLAIECTRSVYGYWVTQVDSGTSPWGTFFQSTGDRNYPNIPFWTAACTEGALIGANASSKGLIAPTTDVVSVNIISALIGALAIGAGKVIFGWVPKIQPSQVVPKISMNIERLARFGGSGGIGVTPNDPIGKPAVTDEGKTYGCNNSGWIACGTLGCPESIWWSDTCDFCSLTGPNSPCYDWV